MRSCSVVGCLTRHSYSAPASTSFHRYPNDPALQAEWLKRTCATDHVSGSDVMRDRYVCCAHFTEADCQYIWRGELYIFKND